VIKISNGKNKEVLRNIFKKNNPNKEPINAKTGKLSKSYEEFLTKECRPHWASVLSKFGKLVPQIEAKEIKAVDALKQSRNKTILEEKCSLGIGGKIASNKKLWEAKYGIKF